MKGKKRKYENLETTGLTEAIELLKALKNIPSLGGINKHINLIEFANEYIQAFQHTLKPSTQKHFKLAINHLVKVVGNINLDQLTVRMVEDFIIITFRRSPSVAYLFYSALRAAFSKAKTWGYVHINLFKEFKPPKYQAPERVIPTPEELEKIIVKTPEEFWRDVFIFLSLVALRISELCNLPLKCVNLKEKFIEIGNDKFDTKSKRIRRVPLSPMALVIARKYHPTDSNIINPNRPLFCKANGCAYSPDLVYRKFKASVRLAGVNDKLTLHSLRHYAATKMLTNGVDVTVVQQICGHKDLRTTLRYLHFDFELLRSAVDKLDDESLSILVANKKVT